MQSFLIVEFVVGLLAGIVLSASSAEREVLRAWSSPVPGDREQH